MDRFANMQAFVAVARTSSFAEAARQLGLATSVVSKRIKDLEQHLDARLLSRTTRRVSLTEAGYQYLSQCLPILDAVEELEDDIRGSGRQAVGHIRLAAPVSFGIRTLGRILAPFLDAYPEVSLDTFLADHRVDLSREGYDLSIRIGHLQDSGLVARRMGSCLRVVCASPDYLAKHGVPAHPEALRAHSCLTYSNLQSGRNWPFQVEGREVLQAVGGRFSADNGDLLCEAAIAGAGLVMLPAFIIQEALAQSRLVPVLEAFQEPPFGVYLVYQNRHHLPNRVRLLMNHLCDTLGPELEAMST